MGAGTRCEIFGGSKRLPLIERQAQATLDFGFEEGAFLLSARPGSRQFT